jgi:hypothetical protein
VNVRIGLLLRSFEISLNRITQSAIKFFEIFERKEMIVTANFNSVGLEKVEQHFKVSENFSRGILADILLVKSWLFFFSKKGKFFQALIRNKVR